MSQRRVRTRSIAVAALAALLTIGGLETASAYWGGSGGGSGGATTGTSLAVTLSPGTPAPGLYPGGRADVTLHVSNPNRSATLIGSLVLDVVEGAGGFAVDADHSGCSVSALSFNTQANGGAGWMVPARVGDVDGTLSITLRDALSMGPAASNACQGARITVYLRVG